MVMLSECGLTKGGKESKEASWKTGGESAENQTSECSAMCSGSGSTQIYCPLSSLVTE